MANDMRYGSSETKMQHLVRTRVRVYGHAVILLQLPYTRSHTDTHKLTHTLTHSLTHSLTYSLVHLQYLLTYFLTHQSTYLSVHLSLFLKACFTGGMYALASVHATDGNTAHYMNIGKNITRTCYESYQRTRESNRVAERARHCDIKN